MKSFFTILLLAFSFSTAFGQQTYVPDDNFEAFLEANAMGNGIPNDDSVTTANINGIVLLNVNSMSISDLTGIEDFSSLATLFCGDNQLTALDVTQNTALINLYCHQNQIASLDVSNQPALKVLFCGENQLSSLDVTQNTALEQLTCHVNQLTALDITQNPALHYFSCSSNQLTSLNVTQNTALTHLYCNSNLLSSIDLSQNNILDEFGCSDNQITSLDLSQNPILSLIHCQQNQLTSLDVTHLDTTLQILYCSDNALLSLDVSQNMSLVFITCDNNQLTMLDLSNNPALTLMYCRDNDLSCLNVKNGNNVNVSEFYATGNSNLSCIQVDDYLWATANWTINGLNIDAGMSFSTDCGSNCDLALTELNNTPKELVKIVDLMGREVAPQLNTVQIYIYSDGSTDKVYSVE